VNGFWAEVEVLGGFVGDPEAGSIDREVCDDGSIFGVNAEEFDGSECGLIEIDCLRTVSNGEHGGYCCLRGVM
jgi:hypothetical protein